MATKITAPLHVVDWMPTLCSVAGCELTKPNLKWDGRNIWYRHDINSYKSDFDDSFAVPDLGGADEDISESLEELGRWF